MVPSRYIFICIDLAQFNSILAVELSFLAQTSFSLIIQIIQIQILRILMNPK